MQSRNTQNKRGSTRQTRRRTLQAISGLLLGMGVIGTASAQRGVTVIDSSETVIDESGRYVFEDDIQRSAYEFGIDIRADNVTIDGQGNTIDGAINNFATGVAARDVTNITIQNVIIPGVYCLELEEADRCTIRNIILEGHSDEGTAFIMRETTASTVTNTTIRGGMQWPTGSPLVVSGGSNNKFTGNDIGSRLGIYIRDNNTEFIRNTVSGWDSGIRLGGNHNQITNNTVLDAEDGIKITGDHNNVIRNEIRESSNPIIDNGVGNRLKGNITD